MEADDKKELFKTVQATEPVQDNWLGLGKGTHWDDDTMGGRRVVACTQTPCLSCLAGGELAWRLLLLLGDEYVPTTLYCCLQGGGFQSLPHYKGL